MPNEVMKSLTIGANTYDLPQKTSDLTNDSGFLTSFTETDPVFEASAASDITSTDITNWNNKSDFSGSYTDLTGKPTIPTKTSDLTNDSSFITSTTANDTYVSKAGDTITGNVVISRFTGGAVHSPSLRFASDWGDYLTLGTNEDYSYIASGVLQLQANVEMKSGKTLTLAADPTTNLQAATKQYVDNAIPTTTSDLTNDSGFLTTLNVESPITYTNDTIGFDGYDVITTTTTLCNETVTTTDDYNPISGDLAYSNLIDANPIKVTFNGVEYICPQSYYDGGTYYYGAATPSTPDFSKYPFGLQSGSYNALITKNVGTYTIKIEAITDNIAVSSDFAKARGYSIVENPSQILVNESTTTTSSGSTYSEGEVSYFSNLNDVIKVTFNNVEYICPRNNSNYSYGAQYDSSSDIYDFSEYPFNLQPVGNNFTTIYTQTAGTYTVKIENFPKVTVLTDDFKQAIKSSFPGDVMIQGVDYVTAGQASGSNLGYCATAEGENTISSGYGSHAEGTSTTASNQGSHAEGLRTTASALTSHAEGYITTASGQSSHAEGLQTTASGSYSHAEGLWTTANHKSQHVFGEYNVLDTSTASTDSRGNYVEIVGKGNSKSTRSNARTLDWYGNEVLAGKLTVGTGPTANMDVATKQYVDNATSGAGTVTSVRVQATSPVVSSVNTAQSTSLNTTISLANGYGDTKNPYASKTKNYVLAAPSNANGVPSFRALVADDIPSLTKSKISDFPTIPTKTSDLTNDSGFITTDEKVKQTAKSDNVNYKLLFTTSTSPTSGNAAEVAYDTDITINPSTNTITATNFAGNATSATVATKLGTTTSNTTSAGSASVPVYFDGGVPIPVSLDDLRTDMGITNPITFWGVTTTTLTNGSTTTSLAGLSGSPQNGYVVIDGNGAQFIWGTVNNVAQWNQLGTGVAYKIIQSAVSTPTANGNTTAFIDTISQNANGVISITKKNLDTSGTWSGNAGSATKLATARNINGTSFNGTANITTTTWGTARNIYISDSDGSNTGAAVSVNGSNNATLKLPAAIKTTLISDSSSYGEALPASGVTGQVFFQTSDPYYELPAGGSAGQALIKNSSDDRDVTWGNVDALPTQTGNSGKFLTTNGTTASWGNVTLSDYVLKAGDIMTGSLYIKGIQNNLVIQNTGITKGTPPSETTYAQIVFIDNSGDAVHANGHRVGAVEEYYAANGTNRMQMIVYNPNDTIQLANLYIECDNSGTFKAGSSVPFYGAVWNDYAEYRQADSTEPGRCVVEKGDDTLILSSKRMQPGAEIISDTFGFAIGQTDKAQTPIATSGRVLAYPYESLEEFKNAIGRPVCSGPNGTVSIMTDEEYQKFGYCAIGIISAVPEYETWGENDIAVNNRVWIRVR